MSSIFQAMPLYAWIIIGCVIVLAVAVLIKMKFGKSAQQKEYDALDRRLKNIPDRDVPRTHIGGIRKNKNMKKRRKYKK